MLLVVARWISDPVSRLRRAKTNVEPSEVVILAPVPFRGKPNSPLHIPTIAMFIAELKNVSIHDLAKQTNENAQRLFNLPH